MMLSMLLYSGYSHSLDLVKLQIQQLSESKAAHNINVIQRALEITEPEYGAYKLDVIKVTMSGNRMRQSSLEGELINTVFQPADEIWDKQHIAIRIPVRLGLLSYRLLLVNKAELPKFENIYTSEQLKVLTAGLASYWVTTKILKEQGFSVIETGYFDGIFLMLNRKRFDYLPRGIYEVYSELNARKNQLNDIVIEPTLALNIPTYTYVYVSPKSPKVAKRLQAGLEKLLFSGELKTLLYKHYANDIERAKIGHRKIIKIENKYYNGNSNEYDKYLLYSHQKIARISQ